MPHQSLRQCTYPGCSTLVHGGRCVAHDSRRMVIRDPGVKQLYNSKRWKMMRAAQLANHPWCADCLAIGDHTFASEADHITPHHGDPGLFFDETNLQSLCKPHHSSKTANEVWHAE